MKRYLKRLMHVILVALFLCLPQTHMVNADDTVAQLTLYAYGDSLLGSSGESQGHAFLTIENKTDTTLNFLNYPIEPGKMISVSIWPDTMGYGGVYINREMVGSKGAVSSSISVDIDNKQFEKIAEMTPEESYYHDGMGDLISNPLNDIWHNCTTYSTKMWNAVVPKKYRISGNFLGVDAPKLIAKKMKKIEGYKSGEFMHDQTVELSDIFYVTKKSELVPYEVKLPELECVKKTTKTVSLSWTSSDKNLLGDKKDNYTYLIHYYPVKKPSAYKSKTVSSVNTVIRKLQKGEKYKFFISAIYEDGEYRIGSGFSKGLTVTTSQTAAEGNSETGDLTSEAVMEIVTTTKGMPYIGGNTYDTPLYFKEGSGFTSEAVPEHGILGALLMDFDNDGAKDIFAVSYEPSDIRMDGGDSVRFCMLKYVLDSWTVMDEVELLRMSEDGDYFDLSLMSGSGLTSSEGAVFLRNYDGVYQFFFEHYASMEFYADGQDWGLAGYTFEGDKFVQIKQTEGLDFIGSGFQWLWELNEDEMQTLVGWDTETILLKNYRSLGFDNKEFGLLTFLDPYVYSVVKISKNSNLSHNDERVENWLKYRTGILDGVWVTLYNDSDRIPEKLEDYLSKPEKVKTQGADYIIADSDARYLTDEDVKGLTLQQINYAKNEIYARKGRKFSSQELNDYFTSKSWYQGMHDPAEFDQNLQAYLNDYERANGEFLSSAEKQLSPDGYLLDQPGYNVVTTPGKAFSGSGKGTKKSPYKITNAQQLDEMRYDLSAYYVLENDIDLSGNPGWIPIGTEENPFTGKFNGNNHTISNLKIYCTDIEYVGLFGCCTNTIKNVNLKNADVRACSEAARIGIIAGAAADIINCSADGGININNTYYARVGGIAGTVLYKEGIGVRKCINRASIQITTKKYGEYSEEGFYKSTDVECGGIVGEAYVDAGVKKCINYGKIEAVAGDKMSCGGICGTGGTISDCINYGSVYGESKGINGREILGGMCCVGGIVGLTYDDILYSANYGDIHGRLDNGISSNVGGIAGFAGYLSEATIRYCINIGANIDSTGRELKGNTDMNTDAVAYRIANCYGTDIVDCYSLDATKCNGSFPVTDIGTDKINGESLTMDEIKVLLGETAEMDNILE